MRIPHLLAAAALLAVATPHAAGAQADSIDVAAAGAWSYAGPTGPAFWATRFGYAECAAGAPRQSPVDLPARTPTNPLPITLSYPARNPGRLVNTGHTVDLYLLNPATLRVADTTFTFREVHFHVPAEHLVQGVRHAAEIHAVHVRGNAAAVLTTFVTEGERNPAWNVLIDSLPGNRGDTLHIGPTDLMTMLALRDLARETIYSYAGSLTTPLCTPTVRFLIRQEPLVLSREQIEALAAAFARNVRPVQPVTTPITLHRGTP
jgi:carbonic anhydrase